MSVLHLELKQRTRSRFCICIVTLQIFAGVHVFVPVFAFVRSEFSDEAEEKMRQATGDVQPKSYNR